MEIIYHDKDIAVCVKPAGALSTDEPGGVPALVREALGGNAYTVHRLDRAAAGLMVLALRKSAASALSRQISSGDFRKEYLAVLHGAPQAAEGSFTDLLRRDRARRMTVVAEAPGRDVREARLDYRVLETKGGLSLVNIVLHTGRTHQIRVQFASRGLPLAGERKYDTSGDGCGLALWSRLLGFSHPYTGQSLLFEMAPPPEYPWTEFDIPSTIKQDP